MDVCDIMKCRSVQKDWKDLCEQVMRMKYEKDVSRMIEACRYRCPKIPLKWLVGYTRGFRVKPIVYKCASCGRPIYGIGECKSKHWGKGEVLKKICAGPILSLFFLLSFKVYKLILGPVYLRNINPFLSRSLLQLLR